MIRTLLLMFAILLNTTMIQHCMAEASQQGEILYPTPGTTWKVGQSVNVTFKPTSKSSQTVSIFFSNDRETTLAGGPLSQRVYKFKVNEGAMSPPGGTSQLLAVRRENNFLVAVDTVDVHVAR